MSNDRMFAVCEWCGGVALLGKYYPSVDGQPKPGSFDQFCEQHLDCHPRHHEQDTDWGEHIGITIACEMEMARRGVAIGPEMRAIPRLSASHESYLIDMERKSRGQK